MMRTALGLTLLVAGNAWAGECLTDVDCGPGLLCHEVQVPCADTPCAPGETCTPTECVPETYGECQPAPCLADADCGDYLVCVTVTYEECSDAACSSGAECPPPTSEGCTTVEESFCAPPYVVPCAVDADCGADFACMAAEICECSGGDSPEGGGGSPPSCTCSETGERRCAPVLIPCADDAGCPGGWTCESEAQVCDSGAACPPAAAACVPPYWDEVGESLGLETSVTHREAAGRGGCQAAPGAAGGLWLAAALLFLCCRRRSSRDRLG